ncbi:hypothetical protein [Sphingobium chungbukense]|uniref:Copper resistance protein D domain-containing protein n=1 Tax=Sphingobium chungbukense TaxID=56193 RepID=A0A0M3ANL3_9SPHN|nr:hypothetical protein [Sphingobium chungbukense]KKW91732.1 hypothetical protein YP76_11385 [Sphingobium chungbukense]
MTVQTALIIIHLLLFAYWLGADWGVFVTSRYVANPELSLDERRRFLMAAFGIDLMPRIAFTLLLPVGLQLASFYGTAWLQDGPFMIAVWIGSVAWLALNIQGYRLTGTAKGDLLRIIDTRIRYVLAPALIGAGGLSLLTGNPVPQTFIALKLIVFGAMVIVGLVLRHIMRAWAIGFRRLAAEGRSPEVDALFADSLAKAKIIAPFMWGLSGVMVVLGVARFG